jgi:hypothetical protein
VGGCWACGVSAPAASSVQMSICMFVCFLPSSGWGANIVDVRIKGLVWRVWGICGEILPPDAGVGCACGACEEDACRSVSPVVVEYSCQGS